MSDKKHAREQGDDDDDRPLKLKKEFQWPTHAEFKAELEFMLTHFYVNISKNEVEKDKLLQHMAKLREEPAYVDRLFMNACLTDFAFIYMYLHMGKYEAFYRFLNEERRREYKKYAIQIYESLKTKELKQAFSCYETHAKLTEFVRRLLLKPDKDDLLHSSANAIFCVLRLLLKLEENPKVPAAWRLDDMKGFIQKVAIPTLFHANKEKQQHVRHRFVCEVARYVVDELLGEGVGKLQRRNTQAAPKTGADLPDGAGKDAVWTPTESAGALSIFSKLCHGTAYGGFDQQGIWR